MQSINSLAFSENCFQVATGHQNGMYRIWDIKEQKVDFSGTVKFSEITSLAWEPRFKFLVLGTSLGELNVIDPKSKKIQLTHSRKDIAGITKLLFSPTQKELMVASATDGSLSLYNFGEKPSKLGSEDSFLQKTWKIHTNKCTSLANSILNNNLVFSGGLDQRLNIFDLKEFKVVKSITIPFAITSIAASPIGNSLALGGYFGEICLIDLRKPDTKLMSYVGHEKSIVSSIGFLSSEAKTNLENSINQKNEKKSTHNSNFTKQVDKSFPIDQDQSKGVIEYKSTPEYGFNSEKHSNYVSEKISLNHQNPKSGEIENAQRNREKSIVDDKIGEIDYNSKFSQSSDARKKFPNNYTSPKTAVTGLQKTNFDIINKTDESILQTGIRIPDNVQNKIEREVSKLNSNDKEEIKDFIRKEINNLRIDIIKELEFQKSDMKTVVLECLTDFGKSKSN